MSSRSPVFAQIMRALDPTVFARCAARFPTPRRPRGLSAYDHFLALCFAQLTWRESLRDIAACLKARAARAYHLGFRSRVTRTNLAYANAHRDWRLFAALAQHLMRRARQLYHSAPVPDPELPAVTYALDASIIELSLALFPWARWQTHAAALKLHTLLSLRGAIPAWCAVTEATCPEQKTLDLLPLEPGAFYIMDRGYLDFGRLARLDRAEVYFVVRCKCHVRFRVVQSRAVDKTTGLRCDQTIRLTSRWSDQSFGGPLRRIRVRDEAAGRSLVLLTNCFDLPARTISQLYRARWQVELFFKWIKQHLRLRGFFGRSPNAVRVQVWSAICAYLLVAITRKELGLPQSLHQILQIVSVSAFEQSSLAELVAENDLQHLAGESPNQLLFHNL
jgi:hypothetical protein